MPLDPPACEPRPKRPRQYAAEILDLATPAQRRQALDEVPDEWRDWVREYVETAFSLSAARRAADRSP